MQRLQGRVAALIAVLLAGACASVILNLLHHPAFHGRSYTFDVIGFGALVLLAESFPVVLQRGGAYSVSFLVVLAGIITWQGPGLVAVASAFVFFNLGMDRAAPNRLARRTFNASQFVVASTLAGLAYRGAGSLFGRLPAPGFMPHAGVLVPAVVAASLTFFLVNTSLVATVLALRDRTNPFRLWMEEFSSLIVGTFAFGALGVVLAALNVRMGLWAVVFLLVPLLVARSAFQASVKWASFYETTVRSLITAIEKKDAYTRGHAERVAALAERTAAQMGLSPERQRIVRFAALMHDVGKLGVSTRILQKAGKLTAEEYEHMKQHPLRGHEIVGEIDFLAEAVGAVRHHHEKVDGTGYPDGLKGDEIPLLARIITVSDAFDSMTSTRVYRQAKDIEAAFTELHRCMGTQFDESCLAALEAAVTRDGWEVHPETYPTSEEVLNGRAAAF